MKQGLDLALQALCGSVALVAYQLAFARFDQSVPVPHPSFSELELHFFQSQSLSVEM
ncbi:hypothetical protein [Maioricimonas sp. JC845]|uniref:hypothetical protein n=1 Tax=Maioricimonas sp. JC845 TaxID=3232138 RepID=UPI00345949A5